MRNAAPLSGGGIIRLFARHPNAANLVMVLMLLLGIFSIARINTQFFPTIETKSVNITVEWSGASAEDVEANILQVIEPEVRFIDGVDKTVSYAREGVGTISLEFDSSTDMQTATSDVDAAVKTIATLPDDAESPKVSRVAFFDRVASVSISGAVPESTLRVYAKRIRDDLIARGIDKVEFTGLRDEELQVGVPEAELRRLDLSISDISASIAGNSRDLPSGQTEGTIEKQLRTLAEYQRPESLSRVEIRSFASGEKVWLGDVADIRFGFEDGQTRGLSGAVAAIQLSIQRAPTADTLATAKILDDYLAELRPSLPPGVELRKYDVLADALVERIMLLVRNGVGGLILVIATLFLFLNARVALWVAAGIPIAMLATVAVMFALGQSINMITLFGMIMMLGIVVDDAIVVGEHTATRFAEGDSPLDAAEAGAGRMATPVIAAMTTTAVAFAPMFLIRDAMGQIMGVLPVIVIAVLIASMIECFLILPGHLAHSLTPRPPARWSYWRHLFFAFVFGALVLAVAERLSGEGAPAALLSLAGQVNAMRGQLPLLLFVVLLAAASLLAGALVEGLISLFRRRRAGMAETVDLESGGVLRRGFDRGFEWFRSGPFSRFAELAFDWRYLTLAVALAAMMVVAGGLFFGGRVAFVFFPSPEAENVRARIVLNPGLPEARAVGIIREIEDSLDRTAVQLAGDRDKVISAVFTTLGSAGNNVGDNLAQMNVQLLASEFREVRTREFVAAWRRNLPKLPGIDRVSLSERAGGPPGRDVDLRLTGGDVATLKKAAGEIIEVMGAIPGLTGVADDLPYGKPELVMSLLPRGTALGFTLEEVGRQVRNAFEGAVPRRFARGDDEIAIRVTMTSPRQGAAALRAFELRTPAGEFVPLGEVVSLSEKQGFSAIQRRDGATAVAITGDLDTDIMTTELAIARLTEGPMPGIARRHGLTWEFAGRAEERARAFEDLQIGIMIALSAIYIILAWVFSDYWRPLAVMLIIPFGLVGAVLGHWLLGYPLTMMSFISLLGLAGILVNDSIVLVSRMDERLGEGEELREAVVGASRDRLRAVMLTSLTTIGGLVPLLFEKSVQAQFMVPMAITIIFGLGVATLLVLFLVPAFVGIGADMSNALRAIFGERDRHEPRPQRDFGAPRPLDAK